MKFAEFPDTAANSDPRLVETLAFHAVNGKRLTGSRDFLESLDCQWSLKILTVSMEPTRVLIYTWLSLLGKSLKDGERPAIYKLLDPRTSVVVQMLQHYSSLLMSTSGGGRLRLVWPCQAFSSFARFCADHPEKCRQLRRILMLGAGWVFRRHFVYLNSDTLALKMCGDDQAHPHTLNNFLDFWKEKNPCCFPPGICRDFKKNNNIEAKDLQSGHCKSLLFWVASTIQLSIADVEAMHSQNRALAGSSLTDIAAKFINAESKRVQEEALKLATPVQQDGDKPCMSQRKFSQIQVETKKRQPTGCRGSSALELFRYHYLDLLQGPQGGQTTVNPCSRSLWKEVKEAYSNLSDAQKELYESMSQDSKAKASQSRKQRKEQVSKEKKASSSEHVAPASSSPTTTALVANGGTPCGAHLQALPLEQVCDMLAPETDPVQMYASLQRACCLRQEQDTLGQSHHPISEASLDAVWRSQVQAGVSGKAAFKTFQRQAESVARPDDANDVFPSRVVHEGFCGEQCRHYGDPHRIKLHCHTLHLFNFIVSQTLGFLCASMPATANNRF